MTVRGAHLQETETHAPPSPSNGVDYQGISFTAGSVVPGSAKSDPSETAATA
jgi:hypothetical protein